MHIVLIYKILLILIIAASVIVMFKIALSRLVIDMDIVESLPKNDPIVNEAAYKIQSVSLTARNCEKLFAFISQFPEKKNITVNRTAFLFIPVN